MLRDANQEQFACPCCGQAALFVDGGFGFEFDHEGTQVHFAFEGDPAVDFTAWRRAQAQHLSAWLDALRERVGESDELDAYAQRANWTFMRGVELAAGEAGVSGFTMAEQFAEDLIPAMILLRLACDRRPNSPEIGFEEIRCSGLTTVERELAEQLREGVAETIAWRADSFGEQVAARLRTMSFREPCAPKGSYRVTRPNSSRRRQRRRSTARTQRHRAPPGQQPHKPDRPPPPLAKPKISMGGSGLTLLESPPAVYGVWIGDRCFVKRLSEPAHVFRRAEHLFETPPLSVAHEALARLMQEPPDGGGHGHTLGLREQHHDGALTRQRRSLNPDDWVKTDFLAYSKRVGGFTISKSGSTGVPRGRPRKGMIDTEAIRARIDELRNSYSFEELTSSLTRGRHLPEKTARRLALAEIVAQLSPRTNAEALALCLGCSASTVYTLEKDGWEQIEKKSPKGGESICWAFAGWTFAGTRRLNGRRPVPFFRPPPSS